ncbi:hypothetical protein Tco_1324364, partial [Tanacetum coccineum]
DKIDDMLAERGQHAKAQKPEIDLLRRVVQSDSRMSQLLSQLGSQSKIGSSSEAGGGSGNSGGVDDHKGGWGREWE